MPIFSIVELIPFLSISVCCFWFGLSQTRKQSLGEMGVASTEKVADL